MRSSYLTTLSISLEEFHRLQSDQDRRLRALANAIAPCLVDSQRQMAERLELQPQLSEAELENSAADEAWRVANHLLTAWVRSCKEQLVEPRVLRIEASVAQALSKAGFVDELELLKVPVARAVAAVGPDVLDGPAPAP